MDGMNQYKVTFRDYTVTWHELYWAENYNHAEEQAINANPMSRIDRIEIIQQPEKG